jgi:lipoate-protein ligase A
MNMAIDEALFNLAAKEKKFFIRFYDFERSAVVLASSDSAASFIGERNNGMDFTRRISGGKPIYIDNGVFSYCITGPSETTYKQTLNAVEIHKYFGAIIIKAIKGMSNNEINIELGKAYSIRVNGEPIAGHGQHIRNNHSFLYHGILAIGPWDVEGIQKSLRLIREDSDKLSHMPSMSSLPGRHNDISTCKKLLMEGILHRMNQSFEKSCEISQKDKELVLRQAETLSKEVYENDSWIYRKDVQLKEGSRFCLLYEG